MAFPDGTIDLRSDTVTRPTDAMRQAMASAPVGDDVYGEDPTVNALQEEAAAAVGTEAALFVASGTMANQIAINLHTRPGDEAICVDTAHVRNYERGGAGANSGVGFRVIPSADGVMTVDQIADALTAASYGLPPITLVTWENTHNVSGGSVVPIEVIEAGTSVARAQGCAVHLDGARIWNAVAASGTPADRFARSADTMMFCFSKGLGAPVGSVLCGPADLMSTAREVRGRLGGGMRQAGVIAAAARIALSERERVHEDHDLAQRIAVGLAARYPKAVDSTAVSTNMVRIDEAGLPFPATRMKDELAAAGILVGFIRPGILRLVTHRDVDGGDVDRFLAAVDAII